MSKKTIFLQFTVAVSIVLCHFLLSEPIKADRVTQMYTNMDRTAANVNSSIYIYASTVNGVSAGGTISVTLPSAFTFGGSYDFNDTSLAVGNTSNCLTSTFVLKSDSSTASGTVWGVSKTGTTTITYTSGTDTIAGNLCVRIVLSTLGAGHTVTNPNVTSNTVYNVSFATASDVGDAAILILGDASASNVDTVTLNANVASSILMAIDTVTGNCNNNTQTTPANQVVNFGVLFPGTAVISGSTIPYICIEAGTNSAHGMRVLVQSSRSNTIGGLVSGAGTIPSATANLNVASSGYGARVSSTGTPTLGTFTITSPFNSVTSGDVGQISGASGTASQLFTSAGAVRSGSSARVAIELAAKSDTTIPTSTTYTDTLTFTAFTNL